MSERLRVLVLLFPLLVACSSAQTSPPPASPDQPEGFSAFGANGLSAGSQVLVQRSGQWVPATVVRQSGASTWLVHYDGYEARWDESVEASRIRPRDQQATARDYRAGEKVLVRAQNRLLLASIVQQASTNTWRVHYDGYGPEVSEEVGPDRIRRPHNGTSAHGEGQRVSVDVGGGRVMPGKVLAIIAADKWLVRFDGFGPEYDQEVGADRIRPAAATPPPTAEPTPAAPPAAPPEPAAAAGKDKDKGKGKEKDKGKGKEKDKGKDKEPAPPAPPPVATAGPLTVGESVVVSHRGAWHPATITAAGSSGSWKVKYASAGEEEVPGDRVSRLPAPLKGAPYATNQNVWIEWHGMYVPGRVVKEAAKGQYKVRFEGQGPEMDEVVLAKRLRPRN